MVTCPRFFASHVGGKETVQKGTITARVSSSAKGLGLAASPGGADELPREVAAGTREAALRQTAAGHLLGCPKSKAEGRRQRQDRRGRSHNTVPWGWQWGQGLGPEGAIGARGWAFASPLAVELGRERDGDGLPAGLRGEGARGSRPLWPEGLGQRGAGSARPKAVKMPPEAHLPGTLRARDWLPVSASGSCAAPTWEALALLSC